jgi:hypothetical protein
MPSIFLYQFFYTISVHAIGNQKIAAPLVFVFEFNCSNTIGVSCPLQIRDLNSKYQNQKLKLDHMPWPWSAMVGPRTMVAPGHSGMDTGQA